MNSNARPQALPNPFSRAKGVLLSPHTEWSIIASESPSVVDLYTTYILIMAAIPALASLIASSLRMTVTMHVVSLVTPFLVYVMVLASPLIVGLIIYALAPAFGAMRNYEQALKVATYAHTPSWVASVFSVVPGVGRLATLAGGLYVIYLLYLGLQYTMKVPASHAAAYAVVVVVGPFVVSAALMMGVMGLTLVG